MQHLVLLSNDDRKLVVPRPLAEMSELLHGILSECGDDAEQDCPVPVTEFDLKTLETVFEYCEAVQKQEIGDFWKHNEDVETVSKLTLAANYFNIASLMRDAVGMLATKMDAMSAEQIRETFGIVNDLTDEEVAEICNRYHWGFNDALA